MQKQKKEKQNRSDEVRQYLGWVWVKVPLGEEVSLVSGNTHTVKTENI